MKHLQTLTIAYECESSLGKSLNIQKMTKEFLRVFLKKTSAVYATINEINGDKCSLLNSVGKDEFYNMVIDAKPDVIDKFTIVNMIKNKLNYKTLYIGLDGYCLIFVYSQINRLDIKAIANIFYSLRNKIELGLRSCIEHERLELALLGSNDGIWDWNIIENTIYFSPRWKEMLGYEDSELANEISTWEGRVHPDDLEKTLFDIQNNIDANTNHYENIHRLRHKDGHWVWILAQGKTLFDEGGITIRMIGTHTDITSEKKMQLKFAHQAQIIEQIHDAVMSTDLQGNIVSWNRGSELLFGYTDDEVIGKSVIMLHPKEEISLVKKNLSIVLQNGGHSQELQLITKSKKTIYVHLSLSQLKDEKGNFIGLVGYAKDITQRRQALEKLEEQKNILHYQAYHDALTGLPNRSLFQVHLQQAIEKAKRNTTKIALFFIDLDHFKEINDSLGHGTGDEVLKTVTQRLQSVIRQEDTLARLGGDEFTIIVEELPHEQSATLMAQKILNCLKESIIIDSHTLYVSTSIGISLYPQDGEEYEHLLKYADAAMYKAKNEGRSNFQFYSAEMTERAFERMVMQTSLRQAVDNEEFVVYYQPQIDAKSNQFIGIEALIRWQHPTMGLVSPAKFIPLAHETGLIIDMDQWVMKTAMQQMLKWYNRGFNPGKLALNLSVKQIQQDSFISILENILQESGFETKNLELEVTEDQIMTNPDKAIKVLRKISNLGIEIAIDDFGTGYSSLSYLKKLPIDKLKIDQSFVRDLPHDKEDAAITKTVIALALNLNLSVIAEGVETKEQRDFIVENGCKNIQGYFYSRPIPAAEIEVMLEYGLFN